MSLYSTRKCVTCGALCTNIPVCVGRKTVPVIVEDQEVLLLEDAKGADVGITGDGRLIRGRFEPNPDPHLGYWQVHPLHNCKRKKVMISMSAGEPNDLHK